jgi:hypothetical protein
MKKLSYGLLIFTILIIDASASQKNFVETGYINIQDGELYYEMSEQGDETIEMILLITLNHYPVIADSTTPTFNWDEYTSAKEYIIEVRKINGEII